MIGLHINQIPPIFHWLLRSPTNIDTWQNNHVDHVKPSQAGRGWWLADPQRLGRNNLSKPPPFLSEPCGKTNKTNFAYFPWLQYCFANLGNSTSPQLYRVLYSMKCNPQQPSSFACSSFSIILSLSQSSGRLQSISAQHKSNSLSNCIISCTQR